MDPYYEQRLRDEVIYLHSLWHQGPPGSISHSHRNPNHNYINPRNLLQPANPTHFKKGKKLKTPRGKKGKKRIPGSELPPPDPGIQWPCPPPTENPPTTSSGWPQLNLPPKKPTHVPTLEEEARFTASQAQRKALKLAQEFFKDNAESDGENGDEEGDAEDDVMDEDANVEYDFFGKMFVEDSDLKSYYEKNCENGEYTCLVCGGIGQKVGKRFKDCVALVQHSIAISKTKKRRAHRAYGQVVCKVLGWDFDRLPAVVVLSGGPALVKSGKLQGNAKDGDKEDTNAVKNNVDCVIGESNEAVLEMGFNVSEVVKSDGAVDLSKAMDGELMVCENSVAIGNINGTTDEVVSGVAEGNEGGVVNCMNSLVVADANTEHLDKRVSNVAEGHEEAGAVNHLEPFKKDGVRSDGNEIEGSDKDGVLLDGPKDDHGNQTL
ncbi:hypothetical protein RJ639_041775 [Escallonia herrerae]|uniref:Uncharacterized protein n=1 Tax=Escallonia herrerae TaxID=1293975 RepID=A0AA88WG74_9ASTE|nr:hypothetical protein RJ639_041775 [Escallonia herrerae]